MEEQNAPEGAEEHNIKQPVIVSAIINLVYSDGTHKTAAALARNELGLQINISNVHGAL